MRTSSINLVTLLAITIFLTVPALPIGILGNDTQDQGLISVPGRESPVGKDNWPMYLGNLTHQGYSSSDIPTRNDTEPLWGQRVDNLMGTASPVIYDGVVYLGSGDGHMRGYDIDTGDELWDVHIGNYRIRSAAAIDNGTIYFGADNGHLYGFRLNDMTKVLDVDLGSSEIQSSPLIAEGRAYIGIFKRTLKDHKFFSVDINTGEINWTLLMNDDNNFYGYKETAAYWNGYVYIGGGNGTMLCLDREGFWDGNDGPFTGESDTNTSAPDIIWKVESNDVITSDPMIADGMVYYANEIGNLICRDALTGVEIWTRDLGVGYNSIQSPATYNNNRVYISARDYDRDSNPIVSIYSLDPENGDQIWRFNQSAPETMSESAILIVDGALVFGSKNQNVYCISTVEERIADEDRILWRVFTGAAVTSTPAIASGRVFVSNEPIGAFGKLYAIGSPDPAVLSVWTSDDQPYIGESIQLGADILNNATVDCRIDVEFKVSNINNSKQEIVGIIEDIELSAGETGSVQIEWTVKEGFEFLAVFIKEVTPEDLDPENNFGTFDLTIKSQLSGYWTSAGSGPEKTAGAGRRLESNRSYWEYDFSTPWTGEIESMWFENFNGNGTISSSGSAIYFVDPEGDLVAMNTSIGVDGEPGLFWKYSNSSVDFTGRPVVLVDQERSFNGPNKIFSYGDDGAIWAFDWVGFWDERNDGDYISETGSGQKDGDVIWRSQIYEPVKPLMVCGGNLIIASKTGVISGIDDDTGDVSWTWSLPYTQHFDMAGDEHSLYVTYHNFIDVIDPSNGDLKYSMRLDGYSTDEIKSISLTERGILVNTNNSTSLFDRDPSDGIDEGIIDNSSTSDLIWKIDHQIDLLSPPAISPSNSVIGVISGERAGFYHLNNGTEISNLTFTGEQTGKIVSGGDSFYFLTGSAPWVVRSITPTEVTDLDLTWTLDLTSNPRGELVIVGDHMFISLTEGRIMSIGADNNEPVAVISTPEEGILIFPGETLSLDASTSYDVEEDPLTYVWLLEGNSQPIYEGIEPIVNLTVEGVGTKVLTLRVYDDMRAYGEDSINITLLRRGRFHYEDSLYNIKVDISYGISESSGLLLVNSSIPAEPPVADGGVFTARLDLTVWPSYAQYRIEFANITIMYGDKEFNQRMVVDRMSLFRYDETSTSWTRPDMDGVDNVSKSVYGNFTDFISGYYAIGILDNSIPELRHRQAEDYRYKEVNSNNFKFRVEYRDEDNEPPQYIKLVIDNKTEYMMVDEGFSSTVVRWAFYSLGDIPLVPGDHSYYFEANDGNFIVTSQYYNYYVANTPPVAVIIGPTSVVYVGDIILFDGSDSYDPDGNEISYSWDFNANDGIQKDKVDSKVDTIYYDEGNYIITLTVSDGVDKTEKTLSITVLDTDEKDSGSKIPTGVWLMVIVIIAILILFIIIFIIISRKDHEEHRDISRRFEGKWTCPECGTGIPKGVEECPRCDYIYDPMDFDEDDIDKYLEDVDEM